MPQIRLEADKRGERALYIFLLPSKYFGGTPKSDRGKEGISKTRLKIAFYCSHGEFFFQ